MPNEYPIPLLWHLKVSNFNEKARWALDYKRVAHARRAVEPGRHRAVARKLTGGNTFPVLELNGDVIGDSTYIIEALENNYPDPPLYPRDPRERKRALELEDFFDEELGPYTRLLALNSALEDRELMIEMFVPEMPGWRRRLSPALWPAVRRKVISDFEIDELSVEHAYQKLHSAGRRFRTGLQPSGYLVGDRFSVADLTLAALVAPVVAPQQFPYPQPQRGHPLFERPRAALAEFGIADWTRDLYARYRGSSAEVAQEPQAVAA